MSDKSTKGIGIAMSGKSLAGVKLHLKVMIDTIVGQVQRSANAGETPFSHVICFMKREGPTLDSWLVSIGEKLASRKCAVPHVLDSKRELIVALVERLDEARQLPRDERVAVKDAVIAELLDLE